jgi:hypothetical protein
MKFLAAFFLIQAFAASASEIDLAVIQFPEPKTAELLNEALKKVDLSAITNSDRTMTKEPALQYGTVLFIQSTNSANLNSSTRLRNVRADVSGAYNKGRIDVQITISEGSEVGLSSFNKRVFRGSDALPPGATRVISLRQIKRKSTVGEKGRLDIREKESTIALIARER